MAGARWVFTLLALGALAWAGAVWAMVARVEGASERTRSELRRSDAPP